MNILILYCDGDGMQHIHIIQNAPADTDVATMDVDAVLADFDYNAAGGTFVVALDSLERPTVVDADGDEVAATFA